MSLLLNFEELCKCCPLDDLKKTIDWCRDNNLIAKKLKCYKCLAYMFETKSTNFKCGFVFQCPKCSTKKAITTHSFFHNSNLSLAIQLRILHLFAQNTFSWNCWRNKSSLQNGGKFWTTIEVWFVSNIIHLKTTNFRNCIGENVASYPVVLGANQSVVEVDESMFGRQKYHRGRKVKGHWVLGAKDKTTKQIFLKHVEKRDKPTLEDSLRQVIAPGFKSIFIISRITRCHCLLTFVFRL